jgi:hypothetical protein
MPFTVRPYRRFPVPCAVTYSAAVLQWSGGQEITIESDVIEQHTHAWIRTQVRCLVREPTRIDP